MNEKHSLPAFLYAKANSPTDVTLMNIMKEQDETPESTNPKYPRFTLVVGPSPFTMPRGWEYYLCTPYEGVTYISTVLYNAGYPVKIVDVRYVKDPLQEAFKAVQSDTDVLGIATFEDSFPFVRELIEMVKTANPKLPIICGGSLVSSVPRVFMEHTKADIAVISEGELTILELMESYRRSEWRKDLPTIHGIWYRDASGNVHKNQPRGQMLNLDCLPRMRLELWPQAKDSRRAQPQIIASYSRGCKMDCSFCYRTTPQVAMKSTEKFAKDLAWLKERYGITFVFFADLAFNAIKDKALGITDVIKQHSIRWTCMTRCADVDREQLTAMREAGCDIALFGVESLGENALKEARKPTTENVSIRAMHLAFETGVRFGALLIVGLPGETESSLNHMADWAEEYNHVTRVKYLSSMPGTSVCQLGIERGFMRSEVDHLNWLSIEQCLYEDEFLNMSGLPEAVIRQAYKRMYDAYQPGPVMEFNYYPEHFLYFHPNADDGKARSIDYAGEGWRSEFSSAGPYLIPGSDRFTLDKMGPPGAAEAGAALTVCGAKRMMEPKQNGLPER